MLVAIALVLGWLTIKTQLHRWRAARKWLDCAYAVVELASVRAGYVAGM
jgi:hypothetical protein